jgi:hypothetical protein
MDIFKFKQFHLENHCETNIILKLLVKMDIIYYITRGTDYIKTCVVIMKKV